MFDAFMQTRLVEIIFFCFHNCQCKCCLIIKNLKQNIQQSKYEWEY